MTHTLIVNIWHICIDVQYMYIVIMYMYTSMLPIFCIDALYVQVDTRYGDLSDDFVVAQSW